MIRYFYFVNDYQAFFIASYRDHGWRLPGREMSVSELESCLVYSEFPAEDMPELASKSRQLLFIKQTNIYVTWSTGYHWFKIVSHKCLVMTYFCGKNDVYCTIFMFAEQQIHGNIFASMSREDIATIFPWPESSLWGWSFIGLFKMSVAHRHHRQTWIPVSSWMI